METSKSFEGLLGPDEPFTEESMQRIPAIMRTGEQRGESLVQLQQRSSELLREAEGLDEDPVMAIIAERVAKGGEDEEATAVTREMVKALQHKLALLWRGMEGFAHSVDAWCARSLAESRVR